MMTITLTEAEHEALKAVVKGEGGAQDLFRKLQGQCKPTITLDDEDLAAIRDVAGWADGDGGFQRRIKKIFGRSLAVPHRPLA